MVDLNHLPYMNGTRGPGDYYEVDDIKAGVRLPEMAGTRVIGRKIHIWCNESSRV